MPTHARARTIGKPHPKRLPSRKFKPRLKNSRNSARLRALSVLSEMRHGKSLAQATRLERTTPRTVRAVLGKQLKRTPSGRYAATRADTLRRVLNVFSPDGYVQAVVRSSRQAELASQHLNAIGQFLVTGDRDLLMPFAGKRIGGVELLADPNRIEEFATAGLVKLDGLYRSGGRAAE